MLQFCVIKLFEAIVSQFVVYITVLLPRDTQGKKLWRRINLSTVAFFFSQGNRNICVPAEMIVPLINFGGKIVHLVDSANVMKQGWLWEVRIFSPFFSLFFIFLLFILQLASLFFIIIALDAILLRNASKSAIYAQDSGWLSHGASFILTYDMHIFGVLLRTKRHEARIRN